MTLATSQEEVAIFGETDLRQVSGVTVQVDSVMVQRSGPQSHTPTQDSNVDGLHGGTMESPSVVPPSSACAVPGLLSICALSLRQIDKL